jgi:hypothetical protein
VWTQELAAEQTYFDEALECRERQREGLSQAPTAAPHKGAAAVLKRFADEAISSLAHPTRLSHSDALIMRVMSRGTWLQRHLERRAGRPCR